MEQKKDITSKRTSVRSHHGNQHIKNTEGCINKNSTEITSTVLTLSTKNTTPTKVICLR